MASVYVDGVLAQDDIDCYSGSPRAVFQLFNKTGLSNGNHTIKVVVKGTKNAASNGVALVHDYFSVSSFATPTVFITGDLSFAAVKKNSTASKIFTITNTGSTLLSVSSLELPAGFTSDWSSGAIAAAGHQDVKITFTPTREIVYSGLINVNTNTGIYTIAVSGTGINTHTMNTTLPGNTNIRYMGRIDFSNPDKPLFAFPNVTIKAKFEGTSLNLLLKDYNGSDFTNNYFQSSVDGETPVKFMVTSSQQTYPIAKNLTDGTHTVEIVKVTESYNGECQFLGFQTDTLKNLVATDPLPELKLEFYGNSITCGYGIEGGTQPDADNSSKAYSSVVAHELNAQFHTISYSGIGVVKGFPSFLMSQMYNRIIANTTYIPLPAKNSWDFSSYIPDYVIVALGTNDYNLGFGAGTISTTTFNTGYISLISKIRSAYPNTKIICTNSPMISDMKLGNAINDDVTGLKTSGDDKIYYFAFTHMAGGGVNGHPGVVDGQTNGKELADYIKTLSLTSIVPEVSPNLNSFRIFPNPVRNTLSFNGVENVNSIEITDMDGKLIMSKEMKGSTKMDITGYPTGIFIVKATDIKGKFFIRKIVKN